MNILDFGKMKAESRKITMVTSYDFWSARIISKSEIDSILVGDSVAMVVHGFPTTVSATVEMIVLHTAAVARGAGTKFIVADMPFLSVSRGVAPAMDAVDALMKAGAHAIKIEGVLGHEDIIQKIVRAGIPVMGHLGLTPQSIHQLGGYKVQGRDKATAQSLMEQSQCLERLGCFALVLECVPSELAADISKTLRIPIIGIGAGVEVDGQVLVLQDLLGISGDFKPKFLRHFIQGTPLLTQALNQYHAEVLGGTFPNTEESYS